MTEPAYSVDAQDPTLLREGNVWDETGTVLPATSPLPNKTAQENSEYPLLHRLRCANAPEGGENHHHTPSLQVPQEGLGAKMSLSPTGFLPSFALSPQPLRPTQ